MMYNKQSIINIALLSVLIVLLVSLIIISVIMSSGRIMF